MKNIAKFLALGVFAASTTLVAHADTLVLGGIGFGDNGSSFTGGAAGGTITFGNQGEIENITPIAGDTISPYFSSSVGVAGDVTFIASTIYGAQGSTTTLSANPTSGGVQIATITASDGETLTFFVTGETVELANGTFLDLMGDGYFTESGPAGPIYTATAATFTLTASKTGGTTFSLSGDAATNPPAATPEPSSLMLLGTGLASAAGMVFRRRRSVA
jgi:hypothetical protein